MRWPGLLTALIGGYLVSRLVWLGVRPTFRQPSFRRENYRGTTIPTGVGLVMTVTLVLIEGVRALVNAIGSHGLRSAPGQRASFVLVAVGFALVGLFDDFASAQPGNAVTDDRAGEVSEEETSLSGVGGFSGHWRGARQGVLTSGGLKLLVGAALALVAVAPLGRGLLGLLLDSTLIALSANLANLFDRAPGRTLKVSTLAFVLLAILASRRNMLPDVALVIGAGLALFVEDVRERLMLGDAGANVLGAALGLGVVMSCGPATRTTVLIVVAGLNLVSEVASFSRIIDAAPPLRALDRWGRRR